MTMKEHEHTYIPAQIAEECSVCGLLKSTIDSMNKTSDQVVDEALTPMIEELPKFDVRGLPAAQRMMWHKINKLIMAVNKLNRP